MLSTPTQQGPTNAPVKTPPEGPSVSRASPGMIGAVSPPAAALASALGAVLASALGAVDAAVVGAAADAAGEPLDVDPPQAAKRMDTTTSIGSRARPLVHGVWIIVASSTMPTASAT